jgi:hypothetical protein
VGVQSFGDRRSRLRRPLRKSGMPSRGAVIMMLSRGLAPLKQKPSGVPPTLVTRWELWPGLHRSEGVGR